MLRHPTLAHPRLCPKGEAGRLVLRGLAELGREAYHVSLYYVVPNRRSTLPCLSSLEYHISAQSHADLRTVAARADGERLAEQEALAEQAAGAETAASQKAAPRARSARRGKTEPLRELRRAMVQLEQRRCDLKERLLEEQELGRAEDAPARWRRAPASGALELGASDDSSSCATGDTGGSDDTVVKSALECGGQPPVFYRESTQQSP